MSKTFAFRDDSRLRLRSAGPRLSGRGSVGAPSPARRCPLPAAVCRLWLRLAALCLIGAMPPTLHAATFYFPHYADGAGYTMLFSVSNVARATATGRMTFYDPAGAQQTLPFETGSTSQFDLVLAPNATFAAATTGTSNPLRIGYIQIEIDQEEIAAVAVFRHSSGVEASVLATKVARRFSLFVDRSPTLDTGVAVVRASTLPVRAKLYDDRGTLVAEGDFPLTGNQAARFVGEVFPSVGTLRGVLTLESEGAFAPLGLRLGNGSLATTALSSPSAARVAYRVHGVNFGPYTDGQDPRIRPQISEELLRARMEILAPNVNWVRTYGSRSGVEKAGAIAHAMGLKIAAGAWIDTSRSANELELAAVIASAQAGNVDLAIIGSETLLRGSVSASELVDYINRFRAAAPAVPVTTADVYSKLLANPSVMAACDVVMANYYPYWEGLSLADALVAVDGWHRRLKAAAASKPVLVSETGWPSCGNSIGAAVPSAENASAYFLGFTSWARAGGVDSFYFEGLDEPWKTATEGPQGACWGVWDRTGALKPGMQQVFDGLTVADTWSNPPVPGGPGAPSVALTSVPPIGSQEDLRGRVEHLARPTDYKIAVCIFVGSGWWTKPFADRPLTTVAADGTWTCDITTGGNDAQATRVAVYVVPIGYEPPILAGAASIPAAFDQAAVAKVEVTR